jgi:2-methylcitrate dehydratase PrpD
VHGELGLEAFAETAVHEPEVRKAAARVRYEIDPNKPYPDNFTGHIRARLRDGSVIEERQAHFRGGAHEPLTRADIEEKFALNCRHGGWDEAHIAAALKLARGLYDGKIDLAPLRR